MSPAEEHMGFLVRWTQRAVRSRWFEQWTFEDILSESFLRADFLLREKYRKERGSPTVFLGSCLRTDLSYAYQRFLGKSIRWVAKEGGGRRRTWVQRAPAVDCLESIAPDVSGAGVEVDFSEIDLEPRERRIVFMLMENRTRVDIANRLDISPSRIGQIIVDDIRPKINAWVKGEPKPEEDQPANGTHKSVS